MKLFLSILFLAAGISLLPGQTNISTNAVNDVLALVTTNPPPASTNDSTLAQKLITIESVGPAIFDLNNHWVTYSDQVRASDSQMKLTCEWLRANLPMEGGQPTNIVAKTNVVVDFTDQNGQKTHVTGRKGVYFYHVENGVTNSTITLTGGPPKVEKGLNTITGSSIIWDRLTGLITVTDPKGTGLLPGTNTNGPAGTNSGAGSDLFQLK
jgi:lipopolysaccharide export system protein LptA